MAQGSQLIILLVSVVRLCYVWNILK
uniref:Uncharacterized protein n=1 Tax=Anguilla anguilla TaxID=7936 RepID=A0A0E9RC97_ANGAN